MNVQREYFTKIFWRKNWHIKYWKIRLQSHILGEMRTYLKIPSGLKGALVHFHIFAMKSKNWFYFTSLQISFHFEHLHLLILIQILMVIKVRGGWNCWTAFGAQLMVLEGFPIENFRFLISIIQSWAAAKHRRCGDFILKCSFYGKGCWCWLALASVS